MRRLLIGILLRLLDRTLPIDYKKVNKKALADWAYKSFDDRGWRSYVAYEDLKILKEMSFGKDRETYLILVGRRLQLLHLFDEMRKAYELKKSVEEKRKASRKSKRKSRGRNIIKTEDPNDESNS